MISFIQYPDIMKKPPVKHTIWCINILLYVEKVIIKVNSNLQLLENMYLSSMNVRHKKNNDFRKSLGELWIHVTQYQTKASYKCEVLCISTEWTKHALSLLHLMLRHKINFEISYTFWRLYLILKLRIPQMISKIKFFLYIMWDYHEHTYCNVFQKFAKF